MFNMSKMTRYDIQNNMLIRKQSIELNPDYFGEGADYFEKNGKVFFYQLTWKNRVMLANKPRVRPRFRA